MTTGNSEPNPRCLSVCRKVRICNMMELRGDLLVAGGDPTVAAEMIGTESIESDIIDGVMDKAAAERIVLGLAPYAPAARQEMQEAGELLQHSSAKLRQVLVGSCVEGPYIDGELNMCRSEQGAGFMFTEEDLR